MVKGDEMKQITFKSDPIEYAGMIGAWKDYRDSYSGKRNLYSGRSNPLHYEVNDSGNKYTVVIYETKKYIMIEVQV